MSRISPIRLVLTALVTFVAGVVAGPQTAMAVVSGSGSQSKAFAVSDGDYPWTVAIVERAGSPQSQFCGGTLIALDRVLTAAHCIDPSGPNQATADSIDVLVDQVSLAATGCTGTSCAADTNRRVGRRVHVSQISLHRNADILQVGGPSDHFYYDLAILTLAEPLPASYASAVVKPVGPAGENLPESEGDETWGAENDSVDGVNTFVAGWGLLAEGASSAPNVMRFGGGSSMERLDDGECGRRYPGEFRAEDMLCVGIWNLSETTTTYQGIDACQGDSGGPLLRSAYQRDYVKLSVPEARAWAAPVFMNLDPTQRAAATAQALASLDANALAALRTEARASITAEQRSDWEAVIRAALTDEEKTRPPADQDAIVADRLAARVDVEVNAIVATTSVIGTDSVYGNLYRQRLSDEIARQINSYKHEGRHWRLMGVVSWGEGCGRKDKPGIYARVGAEKLNRYVVDPAPATMPHVAAGQAGPTVTGTFAVGQNVTCEPAGVVGASDFTYAMWRDVNGDGSRTAADRTLTSTRQTYTVSATDVSALKESDLAGGVAIGCTVKARGDGGYATVTGAVSRVSAPRATTPGGAGPSTPATPVPTPIPTPGAADRTAPKLSKKAAVCSTTSCRVSIVALDTGAVATGMKTVTAKAKIVRKAKCRATKGKYKGKLRPCVKTLTKTLLLTHSGDQWVAKISSLKKQDRITITFVGRDVAGNASKIAIVAKLRTSR